MSGATEPLPDLPTLNSSPDLAGLFGRSKRIVSVPLSVLSFWAAVALPAVYIPLLFAGLQTVDGLVLFLGLFGLHLLALVGGRSYRRDDAGPDR